MRPTVNAGGEKPSLGQGYNQPSAQGHARTYVEQKAAGTAWLALPAYGQTCRDGFALERSGNVCHRPRGAARNFPMADVPPFTGGSPSNS